MKHRATLPLLAAAALFAGACGGDVDTSADSPGVETDAQMDASMESPAVVITWPADGATVVGSTITVELEARGFQVVEAGDTTANSGHHHLFLDRDVSAPDIAIPAEEGFIVHMGDGSESYTFEDVSPGNHRLIAVVGDAYHVPVPGLQDTVNFTVE